MSSVRMCDNCRAIFSERDPGWQRGTVRNLAIINGESVVQTQEEDRCPNCAVGAIAQGNAVKVYEPEVPRTLRGMDPRIQSGLAAIAGLPDADRQAVADVYKAGGAIDLGAQGAPPAPEQLPDVAPVLPRSLPGTVGPTTKGLPPADVVDADHEELEP